MTHNFEKVETADEFNGAWRDFDGEDELEDHDISPYFTKHRLAIDLGLDEFQF